jgi:hypothetical protein
MIGLENKHKSKADDRDRRDLQEDILFHFDPPVVPNLNRRKTCARDFFEIALDSGNYLLTFEKNGR